MKYRIIAAHKVAYPDPIRFSKGQILSLGKRDDQYPGWVWTATPDGKEGWAPEMILEVQADRRAVATEDYTAKELGTVVGETVLMRRQLNGWGWVQNGKGEEGWIPLSSLEISL